MEPKIVKRSLNSTFKPSLRGNSSKTLGEVRQNKILYLFMLPFLLITLIFGIWPVAESILLSFVDSSTALTENRKFIGLDNYFIIFNDSYFIKSLVTTIQYTALSVPLNIILALGIAILLTKVKFGGLFFKVAIFTPVIVPDVVGAIIWRWLFNNDVGIVNQLLKWVGLEPVGWLTDSGIVIFTLLIVELWKHIGLYTIIFLTNFQYIDKSKYEASYIDGANKWQRFWYITLPELKPALILNSIYALIQFLKTFTVALIMTQGGPNYSTNFVSYYAYQKFSTLQYGEATAMATVLFTVVVLVTVCMYSVTRNRGEA
ncbi:carbohydrate ABC transporter permease [Metabacillus sp. SLBN-84]